LLTAYAVFYPLKNSLGMSEETRRAFFTVIPFPDICKETYWANFLFMQNQYPMAGCMAYTWSLAVQIQFYLFLPIVLLLVKQSTENFR
jgi:peptidoglycan/LPS O-acetylase OafA/YrhL